MELLESGLLDSMQRGEPLESTNPKLIYDPSYFLFFVFETVELDVVTLSSGSLIAVFSALQEWFLGTNLQWGIVTYPRLRYRRDIIFGFTDVLVAVGSMAGLFLGCSVLSFMELIYFLTLRLFWYTTSAWKR
ncbi:hypothetical protein EVAR_63976_1 [Eumeta japonica]|uniref:Uncharacterized protein n=1 Tax=Eumeta variegata TaxID=151549 RepID=A0A4C1ZEI9_EUMVA|nr:hypothetical protein EVAR_63976_1 [Eumeta japonica]